MMPARDELTEKLHRLATQGVFLGTSSWKYPGWFGSIYDRDHYVWRGRFSQARFERDCLAEYSRMFYAVSVDATFYTYPSRAMLLGLGAQVPDGFQFAFKVTDEITTRQFPRLPRFGWRAGLRNENFLNPTLFTEAFLAPFEEIRPKVGLLMFEFTRFGPAEFARGAEFAAELDEFLGRLPLGWPYGVELRNQQWLQPEYFATLARHGVTHIFNAWADMPTVEEQVALPGCETNPSLLASRFLLREGRKYGDAVKQFSPYTEIKDPNPPGRKAAAKLARRALQSHNRTKTLIFVNNRYEGHSPGTIQAIVEEIERDG